MMGEQRLSQRRRRLDRRHLAQRAVGARRIFVERGDRRAAAKPVEFGFGSRLRGKDGKVGRSLGFVRVRSLARKRLQTAGLSERARTGANGRWLLPCRRSRVRVPSSALGKTRSGGCCTKPLSGGFLSSAP